MRAEATRPYAPASSQIRKVAVVVNRRAGRARREPRLVDGLARVVRGRGEVLATTRLDELDDAVQRAREQEVDTLAICGGDGTNAYTLPAMARAWRDAPWPRVVLLAGGTVNAAATSLGTSGSAERRLESLLSAREVQVRRQPLMRVNDHIGLIFGSQMPARILDAYYDGRTGWAKCFYLAARVLGSAAVSGPFAKSLFTAEPVSLEIDGQRTGVHEATGILASVVSSPAVGLRITSRAGENGGFHLVAVNQPPYSLLADAPRMWAGLPLTRAAYDGVAHQARIETPRATRYTLDGELFSSTRIALEATRSVDLLLPAH